MATEEKETLRDIEIEKHKCHIFKLEKSLEQARMLHILDYYVIETMNKFKNDNELSEEDQEVINERIKKIKENDQRDFYEKQIKNSFEKLNEIFLKHD